MKKLIIIALLCLVFQPNLVLASPGGLDQYGGHFCRANCYLWQLSDSQYHYHNFPMTPAYLSGQMQTPNSSYLFYLPEIDAKELTQTQASFLNNPLNELVQNSEIDKRFCDNAPIFSHGLYDSWNRARVKPVCENNETIVRTTSTIPMQNYYKNIPDPGTQTITKVYHYEFTITGKNIYTDMPDISELKGKLIQGVTDSALYYVNRYDDPLTLRLVTQEKAAYLVGENYQDLILYFDDSIVYSYKIGKPLY